MSFFKDCINEIMAEADFGVNVKGDLTIDDIKSGEKLFHRPSDAHGSDPLAVVKSLMRYGFSREYTGDNGGNMYGPGVYNVYSLGSSLHKASGYGRIIVQSYLLGGYQNFLIFNEDMAKKVYGSEYRIEDQIRRLMPPKMANKVLKRFDGQLYMNDDDNCDRIKTAQIAVSITSFLGSEIASTKIRGIIYSGGHDGNCAFVRNFSDVVPYSYSTDNGNTWTVGITDELIWRAGHNTDVDANLKHAVDDSGKQMFSNVAKRSINGFVIVYKGDKANYFDVAKNDLISDVWFDYAGNFDENGEAAVLYNGRQYTLQRYEDNFIVIDEEMGPFCYIADLPEQCEATVMSEGTMKATMTMVLNQLLNEHRNYVNQMQTAENIIRRQWESPDDFWYVKVEQRFKDFKSFNRRHGGGYAKYWKRVDGGTDSTHRENHVGWAKICGATVEDAVDSLKNITIHLNPWAAKEMGMKLVDSTGSMEGLIAVCNKFYARAYMTINKRSLSEVQARVDIDKQEGKFGHRAFNHRAGQSKSGNDGTIDWDAKRPWTLIDCDIDDAKAQAELEQFLADHGITPVEAYESHDGKHYVFDKQDVSGLNFSQFFHYDTNNRPGDPPILAKKDANMMLYSPCGI